MTKTNNTATGTCQICERTCKLPKGTVSLHGYKRPGCGWINGNCSGSYAPSFEVSCDALIAHVAQLNRIRAGMQLNLDEAITVVATATEVVEIRTYAGRPQAPCTWIRGTRDERGYDMFTIVAEGRVTRIENDIASITCEINRQAARIASWKPAA